MKVLDVLKQLYSQKKLSYVDYEFLKKLVSEEISRQKRVTEILSAQYKEAMLLLHDRIYELMINLPDMFTKKEVAEYKQAKASIMTYDDIAIAEQQALAELNSK